MFEKKFFQLQIHELCQAEAISGKKLNDSEKNKIPRKKARFHRFFLIGMILKRCFWWIRCIRSEWCIQHNHILDDCSGDMECSLLKLSTTVMCAKQLKKILWSSWWKNCIWPYPECHRLHLPIQAFRFCFFFVQWKKKTEKITNPILKNL